MAWKLGNNIFPYKLYLTPHIKVSECKHLLTLKNKRNKRVIVKNKDKMFDLLKWGCAHLINSKNNAQNRIFQKLSKFFKKIKNNKNPLIWLKFRMQASTYTRKVIYMKFF